MRRRTGSLRSLRLGPALALCALALTATQAAAAEAPARVAPPVAAGAGGDFSAAARRPGCRSQNVIDFQGLLLAFRARHFGRLTCNVPTQLRCRAVLSDAQGPVSRLGDRGRDRCSMASDYSSSKRYPTGAGFIERFVYRIKLRRARERWSGTTGFCPRRSRNQRVLFCRDSHRTNAPLRSVVRH